MSIDKERRIRTRGAETELMEERGDALVPGAGRLLQSIQGPREQAHVIRMLGVDEANRAGCSCIYRHRYKYNPETHGDLYLHNTYLNTPPQSKGRYRHIDWSETQEKSSTAIPSS